MQNERPITEEKIGAVFCRSRSCCATFGSVCYVVDEQGSEKKKEVNDEQYRRRIQIISGSN